MKRLLWTVCLALSVAVFAQEPAPKPEAAEQPPALTELEQLRIEKLNLSLQIVIRDLNMLDLQMRVLRDRYQEMQRERSQLADAIAADKKFDLSKWALDMDAVTIALIDKTKPRNKP